MAPDIAELGRRISRARDPEKGIEEVFAGLFKLLSAEESLVVTFFAEAQRNPVLQKGLVSLIGDGVDALLASLATIFDAERGYLRFAVRNSLMAAVTYFLTDDRFTGDAGERRQYIRMSAKQLARSLRKKGKEGLP